MGCVFTHSFFLHVTAAVVGKPGNEDHALGCALLLISGIHNLLNGGTRSKHSFVIKKKEKKEEI